MECLSEAVKEQFKEKEMSEKPDGFKIAYQEGFQKIRKREYIMSARSVAVLKLRLDDKMSIRKIASELCMSHRTIYKVFKEAGVAYPRIKDQLRVLPYQGNQ